MTSSQRKAADPDAALEHFVTTLNQAVLHAEKQHGFVKRANLAKQLSISMGSVYAYLKGTTLPSSAALEAMLFELHLDGLAIGQLLTLRDEVEIARRTRRDQGSARPSRGSYATELPRDTRQLRGRKRSSSRS